MTLSSCAIVKLRLLHNTSYHFELFGNAATTAKNMGDNEKTVEQHYRSVVRHADAAAHWKIVPATSGNVIQLQPPLSPIGDKRKDMR